MTSTDLQNHDLPKGTYGYSAVKLDDLGASQYTLITLVVDVSPSVTDYITQLEEAIKKIVEGCGHKNNPYADNMLIRIVSFAHDVQEVHGFKMPSECNIDDYTGCLHVRNATALYDAAENAISATTDYASKMSNWDFTVNGIVVLLTDGQDLTSSGTQTDVLRASQAAMKSEALESLMTILIGVGLKDNPNLGVELNEFKTEAKLTQYIGVEELTASVFAKLADFISQSISQTSEALGSGGPSTILDLDF